MLECQFLKISKISKNKIGRSVKASERAFEKMLFLTEIDYFYRKFQDLGGFLDLKSLLDNKIFDKNSQFRSKITFFETPFQTP